MPRRALPIVCGVATIVAAGYGVFRSGGDDLPDWNLSLVILGFAGTLCATFSRFKPLSRIGRIAFLCALLFPAYVAFQLVPLPLFLLRIFDPGRAEIAGALGSIAIPPEFAPLSIVPSKTWIHLSRIAGYALMFFAIQAAVRRAPDRPWAYTLPLIGLGAFEAALGLAQRSIGTEVITGTYRSKDHFAGFLEMALPFAVMYGTAILYRKRGLVVLAASSVIKASVFFAVAAAMFAAITFSLSKAAFLSTLGSMFVMGALALRQIPGGKKWVAFASLAALLVLAFVFLSPNSMVQGFGGVASDPTAEGRWPIAKDTLRMFVAYPLFGIGLGAYFPGLLRYQTWGLGGSWMFSHNDYVQLLSELGILGFLIPAALMISVFACSARAAIRGVSSETRFLGLACSGGISAILIHSFADFNLYIPANAMVLSWICGISASLPVAPEKEPNTPRGRVLVQRGFIFALGCFASLYGAAWLIFFYSFLDKPQVESGFCRFGICYTYGVVEALKSNHGGDLTAVPPAALAALLPRDPAGPYNWEDLADSLQKAGRTAEARASYARALELGPRIPFFLIRAARFHFSQGENKIGLALMKQALEGDPAFGESNFSDYENSKIPLAEILRDGLPADPAIWRSFLGWQIQQKHVTEAIGVWTTLVPRGYADDATANNFVGFLLGKKQPEAAVEAWALYAGSRSKGYPEAERVFNGDFESDPLPQPALDWSMGKAPGAAIGFDREVRHAGARALRVVFDGTQNLNRTGLEQRVVLKGGRYRFNAWVRSKDLTTDEGVALSVAGEEGRGPNFVTEALRGSTEWKLVEREFVAPAGTTVALIRLTRTPSLKFDNVIKGTLWVDQVSIRPVR